nr:glycosyltransferase [Catelliglobosispora koreensis]
MSAHVHSYAANSHEVQSRIRKFWHRDARVIHPPVNTAYFSEQPQGMNQMGRDYLLGAGRWIGYKNFGLMIEIAQQARVPLILAGSGPEEAALRRAAAKASVPVSFEVRPSLPRLRELYWGAKALLYPAHEDFGIVPVEAQACGTPVIGLARGGLLETVADGETGFLVDSLNPQRYAELVGRSDLLSRQTIQGHTAAFSQAAFAQNIAQWLEQDAR